MAAFSIAGSEYIAVSISFFNPLIALTNLKIRITLKTLNILTTYPCEIFTKKSKTEKTLIIKSNQFN